MSGGRDWTTTEARRLHELRAKRVMVRLIAEELGRTEHAIFSFLRYVPASPGSPGYTGRIPQKHRLPPREVGEKLGRADIWSREDMATLRDLAEADASARDVAETLGRSPHAVHSKASKLGIRFKRQGWHQSYQLERETSRYYRNAVQGSAKLRDAILTALAA